MIDTHNLTELTNLTWSELDQLASGTGDTSAVAPLRAGQETKRLLQLYALRDEAVSHPRWRAEHLELLLAADRRAPEVLGELLMLPATGVWLVSTLRHLRGAGPACDPDRADLGYFGALAAAAAYRAGLEFTIEVAPEAGSVFLPDVGRATVGDTPQVTITHAGGELRVGSIRPSSTSRPGWEQRRQLRGQAGGLPITLRLDDLDPYRDCYRRPVTGRLTHEQAAHWQELLEQAWPMLVEHHRGYAEAIAAGLLTIVPLHADRPDLGTASTNVHAFGAVALTTPADAQQLALGLLHEFQHAKLGALLDLVRLYHRDDRPRFYAPWRDDPRPLGAVLQGVYAFLGVTEFWRVQRRVLAAAQARLAEAEFVRWRDRVWRTFCELEASDRFTPIGRRFLAGLRTRQQTWRDEPASPAAVALAQEAAEDHWIGWRLRNRRPDPAAVQRLAAAWRDGTPCPDIAVSTTIVPGEGLLAGSPRVALTRLRITDPQRFDRCHTNQHLLAAFAPGASPADLTLAGGQAAAARQAYRAAIRAGDRRPGPWIGLALACRHDPAGQPPALLRAPELCRAVHQHLATTSAEPVDPLALAQWLRPAAADPDSGHLDGAGRHTVDSAPEPPRPGTSVGTATDPPPAR